MEKNRPWSSSKQLVCNGVAIDTENEEIDKRIDQHSEDRENKGEEDSAVGKDGAKGGDGENGYEQGDGRCTKWGVRESVNEETADKGDEGGVGGHDDGADRPCDYEDGDQLEPNATNCGGAEIGHLNKNQDQHGGNGDQR